MEQLPNKKDVNEDFKRIEYLDHEITIFKKGHYINITKLFEYGNIPNEENEDIWQNSNNLKSLIEYVSEFTEIKEHEHMLVIVKDSENNRPDIAGIYAHPKLAPHIAAQWISTKMAVIITELVTDYYKEIDI